MAYDVADDKRRNKVHKVLKAFALPTQYSLFECRLTPEDVLSLKVRLLEVLNQEEDSLILLPLCSTCRGKLERYGIQRSLLPEQDTIVL